MTKCGGDFEEKAKKIEEKRTRFEPKGAFVCAFMGFLYFYSTLLS